MDKNRCGRPRLMRNQQGPPTPAPTPPNPTLLTTYHQVHTHKHKPKYVNAYSICLRIFIADRRRSPQPITLLYLVFFFFFLYKKYQLKPNCLPPFCVDIIHSYKSVQYIYILEREREPTFAWV